MVYMYHSFLIHSSADGHLGCFHVLAMINSAVMNTGVHVSLQIWFPWCVCPAVGSLVFLAGKCHGQSSLRGCSPRSVKSQIQLSGLSRARHDVSYKISKQPQRGSYCCFILQVAKLSLREAKWCVQRCTVRQLRGLGLTPRQAVTTANGVHQIQCPFQKSGSKDSPAPPMHDYSQES